MRYFAILTTMIGLFTYSTLEASAGGDPVKGQEIFLRVCASCHPKNPSWGNFKMPAVKGSSRELLEAKILRGSYPPGYKPKKPTMAMKPIPNLKPHIDDLFAFLNQ